MENAEQHGFANESQQQEDRTRRTGHLGHQNKSQPDAAAEHHALKQQQRCDRADQYEQMLSEHIRGLEANPGFKNCQREPHHDPQQNDDESRPARVHPQKRPFSKRRFDVIAQNDHGH